MIATTISWSVQGRQIPVLQTKKVSCSLPCLGLQISTSPPHPQQRDPAPRNAFPVKHPSISWCYIPRATQLPGVMERAQGRQLRKRSAEASGGGAGTEHKVYFHPEGSCTFLSVLYQRGVVGLGRYSESSCSG